MTTDKTKVAVIKDRIGRLEEELRIANWRRDSYMELIASAKKELAESVKPVYEFSMYRDHNLTYFGDKIMDDTIIGIRLEGVVVNEDECKLAGRQVTQGGHKYLYNTQTRKFIMGIGGGRIWISDPESFEALAAWIDNAYPEFEETGELDIQNSQALNDLMYSLNLEEVERQTNPMRTSW